MRYFIFFILFGIVSCDGEKQGNSAMSEDVAKVVNEFCKGQQIQLETAKIMEGYKERGELPGEEIDAKMEEANKLMEAYATDLQALMDKYKGQERTVHSLVKKGVLNCR